MKPRVWYEDLTKVNSTQLTSTCDDVIGHTLKLHAKVIAFTVICLASNLRALHVSLKYRTAQLPDTLRCTVQSLWCRDVVHLSPVCVLMVWCVLFTLLLWHLLRPESPLGTTTVHYWYGMLCLVYLMCVCWCNHKCLHLALTGWSQCPTPCCC